MFVPQIIRQLSHVISDVLLMYLTFLQVMQGGCLIPPTKPKGRPKKNSIPSLGILDSMVFLAAASSASSTNPSTTTWEVWCHKIWQLSSKDNFKENTFKLQTCINKTRINKKVYQRFVSVMGVFHLSNQKQINLRLWSFHETPLSPGLFD